MKKVIMESAMDANWMIIARWNYIEDKLKNNEPLNKDEVRYYNKYMKGKKLEDKIAFLLENNYWEI